MGSETDDIENYNPDLQRCQFGTGAQERVETKPQNTQNA